MKRVAAVLARRIGNLLSRGVVTLSNATGKLQTLQISLLADEDKDSVEHFEPFGFTANPLSGAEVLAGFVDGDRSHGVVIVACDRRYRVVNLAPGESALFNAFGMSVQLTESGIKVFAGGQAISISDAPQVVVAGGDVVVDGVSVKNHVHNVGGSPTSAPVV